MAKLHRKYPLSQLLYQHNRESDIGTTEAGSSDTAPVSSSSDEAALEKWHPAIWISSFQYGACIGIQETSQQRADGTIDGAEALGGAIGAGLILSATEDALNNWNPATDQEEFWDTMLANLESMRDLLSKWVNQEIDSGTVLVDVVPTCESTADVLVDISNQAKKEGLTDGDIADILEEMTSVLDGSISEEANQMDEDKEVAVQELSYDPGQTRTDPFPFNGGVFDVPSWRIEVKDVIRGDEAWDAIQTSDSYLEALEEGYEYVSVLIWAKCNYDDNDSHTISNSDFNITGDGLTRYSAEYWSTTPELDIELYTDGETEGWVTFLVPARETNLMLELDELMNWDEHPRSSCHSSGKE